MLSLGVLRNALCRQPRHALQLSKYDGTIHAPGLATLRPLTRGRVCSQGGIGRSGVALDEARVDAATLALLLLGLHDGQRVWKGHDWAALDRLHEAGLISDPRGRARSVALSDEGLERARAELDRLFGAPDH